MQITSKTQDICIRQTKIRIRRTVSFLCGGQYLHSAGEIRSKISVVIRTQLDESKIRYLSIKVGIQQNVAGFDVPVYDLRLESV